MRVVSNTSPISLRSKARFFISPALEAKIIAAAKEWAPLLIFCPLPNLYAKEIDCRLKTVIDFSRLSVFSVKEWRENDGK